MPYRKTVFSDNEIYHIVNRGVAQAPIFKNKWDYNRFLDIVDFTRYEPSIRYSYYHRMKPHERKDFIAELQKQQAPLIEIVAFCLMPNHFHLLLKQLRKNGIQIFMKALQGSYAKYFNAKYSRVGPLFQSAFRSVRIETTEQLVHVSRYTHLNPSSSFLVKIDDLEDYPFSSFNTYLGKDDYNFVEPKSVLENFKSIANYRKFVFDQAEYQRELDSIKHLLLESS